MNNHFLISLLSYFFRVNDDLPPNSGGCPFWDSKHALLLLLCKTQLVQLITFAFCFIKLTIFTFFLVCINFCVNAKTWWISGWNYSWLVMPLIGWDFEATQFNVIHVKKKNCNREMIIFCLAYALLLLLCKVQQVLTNHFRFLFYTTHNFHLLLWFVWFSQSTPKLGYYLVDYTPNWL